MSAADQAGLRHEAERDSKKNPEGLQGICELKEVFAKIGSAIKFNGDKAEIAE